MNPDMFQETKKSTLDRINKSGWFHGSGSVKTLCLYLALPNDVRRDVVDYLQQAILRRFPDRVEDAPSNRGPEPFLWRFNDHPDTQLADLGLVFDEARELWLKHKEANS